MVASTSLERSAEWWTPRAEDGPRSTRSLRCRSRSCAHSSVRSMSEPCVVIEPPPGANLANRRRILVQVLQGLPHRSCTAVSGPASALCLPPAGTPCGQLAECRNYASLTMRWLIAGAMVAVGSSFVVPSAVATITPPPTLTLLIVSGQSNAVGYQSFVIDPKTHKNVFAEPGSSAADRRVLFTFQESGV